MNKIISLYTDKKNHPISKSDREFLERIAKKIYNSGLVTPAIFFLEIAKPLSLLGSHLLVFLGPIINAFVQSDTYYRKIEVLEKPDNIEILLNMIENLENNE
mgnify:FL=1